MISVTSHAEEALEHLYHHEVEGGSELHDLDDRVVGELLRQGLARYTAGHLTLTKDGRQAAEGAVRRHRLAERLMHDVLDMHGAQVDSAACEFEHSLHHGVGDRICILLGHPTTCPHGRPIPPGKCCRGRKDAAGAVVTPLATMKPGERGAIAYLSSRQADTVPKLMALGVLPGSAVTMVQTFPSIVFQVGQTQVAVDAALASDIYVRRTG